MMKIIKKLKYERYKYPILDDKPCALFDDCADVVTPRIAMLRLSAGGMQADLQRRSSFYSNEELQEYEKATYGVDYIQAYKDYQDAQLEYLKRSKAKQTPPPQNQTPPPQNQTSPSQNQTPPPQTV